MKPKIVNVIEISNGVVTSVDSFIIPEGEDKKITEGVFKDSVIKAGSEELAKAQQLFIDKSIEDGASKDDMDNHLDNGFFEGRNGYSVYLVWSN